MAEQDEEKQQKDALRKIESRKTSRRWGKALQNLNILHYIAIGIFLFIGYHLVNQNMQNPRTVAFIFLIFAILIFLLLMKTTEVREPLSLWEAQQLVKKEVLEQQKAGLFKGEFKLMLMGRLPFSEGIGTNPVPTKYDIWFTITKDSLEKYYCANVDPFSAKILGINYRPAGYDEKKDKIIQPLPDYVTDIAKRDEE